MCHGQGRNTRKIPAAGRRAAAADRSCYESYIDGYDVLPGVQAGTWSNSPPDRRSTHTNRSHAGSGPRPVGQARTGFASPVRAIFYARSWHPACGAARALFFTRDIAGYLALDVECLPSSSARLLELAPSQWSAPRCWANNPAPSPAPSASSTVSHEGPALLHHRHLAGAHLPVLRWLHRHGPEHHHRVLPQRLARNGPTLAPCLFY